MYQALTFQNVLLDEGSQPVSLDVPQGAMVALITARQDENDRLVRVMLGLSRPFSGSVSTLGEDVAAASERSLLDLRRRLSVVHPGGGLVSNLKVWENLVLPLEYHSSLSPAEIEARALAALRRVGYAGGLMELPGPLPLYEKRLIGLARAMLTEPELIIYNAILAGLRGEEKSSIISTIMEFHRQDPKRSSLFVTPNLELISDVSFDSRIFLHGSAR